MEEWELFVKGLTKTFEEFVKKMVEKGREQESRPIKIEKREEIPISRPSPPPEYGRVPLVRKDLGDLENRIIDIIKRSPGGCNLKEIAAALDMQWHYLRIPLRQLVMDGKVRKEGKTYTILERLENKAAPSRTEVRRRVVDAKTLETQRPDTAPAKKEIFFDPREKEILRFKIQTAFRGRPEGLTITELAAVLGRSVEGLDIIVNELVAEKKVQPGKGGKYHLA